MSDDRSGAYPLSVGSLCSGYGGLDMGLALGLSQELRHAWHVEYDAAPSKILAHHHPEVPNYGDLTTLDHSALEPVDWLTAGYPCQPFSDAGKRLGAADARHLWPYVADTIGRLRPRNVLLENVRGHLRRGFDSVLADLAALGYDASWGVVRASEAGAPHRRERIFVVATDTQGNARRLLHGDDVPAGRGAVGRAPDAGGSSAQDADGSTRRERRVAAPGQATGWGPRPDAGRRGGAPATHSERSEGGERRDADLLGGWSATPEQARLGGGAAPDPDGAGLEGGEPATGFLLPAWGVYEPAVRRWERATGRDAVRPTEPRGRGGAERLSPRFVEWLMGLPDGWVTAVPGISANDQLKALGNGVVPQQAALAVSVLLTNGAAKEVAA